jgi:hypothetical protein
MDAIHFCMNTMSKDTLLAGQVGRQNNYSKQLKFDGKYEESLLKGRNKSIFYKIS